MSDAVVIDASIAVKWVLREQDSITARALLQEARSAERTIVAPPLFRAEVANVLYQRERRGEIPAVEVMVALASFLAMPVQILTPDHLYPRAVELARQHRLLAAYDSQHLALAESLDADFWTADMRLYKSLPRSLRWVRALTDFQPSREDS